MQLHNQSCTAKGNVFDMAYSNEQLFVPTNVSDSPTLARLIEEIKNTHSSTIHAYDRVHNRHNR